MRSIKRNLVLIVTILVCFISGLIYLTYKIYRDSSFYMIHSENAVLGKVYDRKENVLFDQKATPDTYGADHFTDVASLIGNNDKQMTNTLVSNNLELLNNYSFSQGIHSADGQSAVYTTLDHEANQKVYQAFGNKNGTAIAYNYVTGEILVCVSKPGLNPFNGYTDLEEGSLLCKAFYKFTPGSTQKISTLAAARASLGEDLLNSMSFSCSGTYLNRGGQTIYCHNLSGHGEENISSAFANSCNVFFAQLVEDDRFNLNDIINSYKKMGYSVNKSDPYVMEINGISVQTASTTLTDKYDFSTQWGCIGQGETMVSPCMLMTWQSAIASETGKSVLPYLISYSTRVDGSKENFAEKSMSREFFDAPTAAYVKNIMIQNGQRYTDTIPGFTLGIKSGTAQVKNGDEENSLLTGFDTNPDHPIAFCVLIEDRHDGDIKTDSIVNTILTSLD
ncbi:MAG: penicillin-binding transpeptidase domain-containing protein [Oscillospiraceae bacterium]|nr:penicillin-binding transpeptidase domain-containing protein [Oscillospiraceae bacterium]